MSIDLRRGIRLSLALLWLFVSGLAQAATGPETAQLLNHRYQQTMAACAGNNPAFFCSGVLIRGVAPAHAGEFWHHDSDAVTLGAERFSYVRADIGTQALAQKHGVIFSDSFTAISQGKALDVLCAYPFVAHITSTRPDYGCGLSSPTAQRLEDPSSCAALGITDATAWLRHFQQNANQPDKQCSLSSQSSTQFKASLEAHQGLDAQWAAEPNELLIRNWDAAQPQRIPLQGLFYDVTQAGGLLGAQKDQRDYFNATGEWLSILRMNLREGPNAVFGFNLQDQLYVGYEVASQLNARYANTAPICADGKAAFYCDGVLIRGADANANFRAWNPSPTSEARNGVSFSYVRSDVGTTNLAGVQGLIFRESSAPVAYQTTFRCAYPVNASTNGIPDSCRASCESLGVISVPSWQARYASTPPSSCAFDSRPWPFQLNTEVRTVLTSAQRANWNEIIIAAWPQDIPAQLPLEAFFYTTGAAALSAAQFIQRDYFVHTGHYMPIVKTTLTATGGNIFSYSPADQALLETLTLDRQVSQRLYRHCVELQGDPPCD